MHTSIWICIDIQKKLPMLVIVSVNRKSTLLLGSCVSLRMPDYRFS